MANNREISQFAGLVTVNDTSSDVSIGASVTVGTGITFNAGAGTAQFAGNATFGGDADADIDAEGVYLGADGKIRARASSGSAYCFIGSQKGSGTSTTVINGEGAATFASGKFDLDANGRLNLRNDISSGQILQCYSGGWTGGDRVASILSTGVATFSGNVNSGDGYSGVSGTGSWIQSGGGVYTRRAANSTDPVFQGGAVGAIDNVNILASGAATFSSTIISGGDAGGGANDGATLNGGSGVSASYSNGPSSIFRGYTTGTSTPTFKVTAAGDATFAGDVGTGNRDPAATDTRGVRIAVDSLNGGVYTQAKSSATPSALIAFQALHGTNEKFKVLYNGTLTSTGNATFDGSLSKGSGSFKISHPLPALTATHNLVHSFIEGPQADLIYSGMVTLVAGKAEINLDTAARMTEGTFLLLNTNLRRFVSNEGGWTAVKSSITGNVLTVEAQDNTCTDEVFWTVIGERKDQHMFDTEWTDENGRVITEPLK